MCFWRAFWCHFSDFWRVCRRPDGLCRAPFGVPFVPFGAGGRIRVGRLGSCMHARASLGRNDALTWPLAQPRHSRQGRALKTHLPTLPDWCVCRRAAGWATRIEGRALSLGGEPSLARLFACVCVGRRASGWATCIEGRANPLGGEPFPWEASALSEADASERLATRGRQRV